jgi:hypothetical protein
VLHHLGLQAGGDRVVRVNGTLKAMASELGLNVGIDRLRTGSLVEGRKGTGEIPLDFLVQASVCRVIETDASAPMPDPGPICLTLTDCLREISLRLGYTAADPIAAIASLIVLAAMLLFAYFVFRPTTSIVPGSTVRMTPAE